MIKKRLSSLPATVVAAVTLPGEHPDGLLFFVFTAPERESLRYESAFQQMLLSVRITR